MNDYREDIAQNLDKYVLGIDDTFMFKCKGCGNCCKNRHDLILNSKDLFNIAKKLALSTEQVIEKYCNTYLGDNSRFPIVRLKPQGVNSACPLLKGSRCSVQDLKPGVCALFPIGRIAKFDTQVGGSDQFNSMDICYIKMECLCPTNRKQTVRSWLERFNIPVEDEFFAKWNEVLFTLSNLIQEFEQKLNSEEALRHIIAAAIFSLYKNYDTDKEFLSQFIENTDKIISLLREIKSSFEQVMAQFLKN